MFFSLYKHTDDGVFDDFPKISECTRTFSENFRKCPKISEDFQRLPKTFEEDPKIFRWYTNEFKYNLRDKLDITEIIDIFTCEDIISFLSICYHSLYHWLLYNKVLFLKIIIFFLKGGSPLPDDKLQECFRKTIRRGKEVRDLTHTACINIDRWFHFP